MTLGPYLLNFIAIPHKFVIDLFAFLFSINDSTSAVDKHPEKRMKAAYEEFENIRLPQLKIENPNARLSQLKQMLRKEWMKSPDNPLNKKLAAMNSNS